MILSRAKQAEESICRDGEALGGGAERLEVDMAGYAVWAGKRGSGYRRLGLWLSVDTGGGLEEVLDVEVDLAGILEGTEVLLEHAGLVLAGVDVLWSRPMVLTVADATPEAGGGTTATETSVYAYECAGVRQIGRILAGMHVVLYQEGVAKRGSTILEEETVGADAQVHVAADGDFEDKGRDVLDGARGRGLCEDAKEEGEMVRLEMGGLEEAEDVGAKGGRHAVSSKRVGGEEKGEKREVGRGGGLEGERERVASECLRGGRRTPVEEREHEPGRERQRPR